ncbi:MAG: helix-turn-helix domain-containing protein [Pseudomonadota bacterium]
MHEEEQQSLFVGQRLKNKRIAVGLTSRQIATALRLNHAHIEAIENDQLASPTMQTFQLGHIRAYALYVNLPAEDLCAQWKQQISSNEESTHFLTPKRPASGVGGILLIIGGVITAIALHFFWVAGHAPALTDDQRITEIPNPDA